MCNGSKNLGHAARRDNRTTARRTGAPAATCNRTSSTEVVAGRLCLSANASTSSRTTMPRLPAGKASVPRMLARVCTAPERIHPISHPRCDMPQRRKLPCAHTCGVPTSTSGLSRFKLSSSRADARPVARRTTTGFAGDRVCRPAVAFALCLSFLEGAANNRAASCSTCSANSLVGTTTTAVVVR